VAKKIPRTLASATLAEKNTNTTKKISLAVFFVETGLHKGSLREGAGAVRRLRESALL
jgi:hypothetical protein